MDIKEYAESVSQCVRDIMDFDAEIKIVSVVKNNGTERTAIIIREESKNISPTIYLDDYYDRYEKANDFERTARTILDIYKRFRIDGDLDVEAYTNFERVKDNIVLKLVNKDRNTEYLKDCPTCDFLDLSVCFVIRAKDERFGEGTIQINNRLIDNWGVSVEELYDIALNNTKVLLPEKRMYFGDILHRLKGNMVDLQLDEMRDFYDGEEGCIILSNTEEVFGATTLIYSSVIKDVASEEEDDLMVVPSSVHELILIPMRLAGVFLDEIDSLIDYVNSTCVGADEVLSDHAYFYSRIKDEILLDVQGLQIE